MKIYQNVCLDEISIEIEYGSSNFGISEHAVVTRTAPEKFCFNLHENIPECLS